MRWRMQLYLRSDLDAKVAKADDSGEDALEDEKVLRLCEVHFARHPEHRHHRKLSQHRRRRDWLRHDVHTGWTMRV